MGHQYDQQQQQPLVLLLLLLIAAATLISASVSSAAVEEKKYGAGAWGVVDKYYNNYKDYYTELGEYAVACHNQLLMASHDDHHQLTFQRVISCDPPFPGLTHRLTIAAADGTGVTHTYEAVVCYKPLIQYKKLISFKLAG
ncbi:hypothetical protein SSX86_015532 [Deinandra increscens subsp. villosa]|uniref:Cystatin domain-containing protein n=1 Tax=Deinandra increscens subsp. villosa TaxID=3103831 RepID=A0AAP0GXK7_9ASTR